MGTFQVGREQQAPLHIDVLYVVLKYARIVSPMPIELSTRMVYKPSEYGSSPLECLVIDSSNSQLHGHFELLQLKLRSQSWSGGVGSSPNIFLPTGFAINVSINRQ